jgi:hypothetical protein
MARELVIGINEGKPGDLGETDTQRRIPSAGQPLPCALVNGQGANQQLGLSLAAAEPLGQIDMDDLQ